eukprot:SAG22_NODE_460_length_10218_cov_5.663109_9_plen_112_part_00
MVLVEDLWARANGEAGIGQEEGTGVAIRKEDEMLKLVEDACGTENNWAPPFTQDYEITTIKAPRGSPQEGQEKYVFRPESTVADGIPRPVFRWAARLQPCCPPAFAWSAPF